MLQRLFTSWELEYSVEYVPNIKGGYNVAIEKPRKMAVTEEAIHNSYTTKEAGKLCSQLITPAVGRERKPYKPKAEGVEAANKLVHGGKEHNPSYLIGRLIRKK